MNSDSGRDMAEGVQNGFAYTPALFWELRSPGARIKSMAASGRRLQT